MNKRETIDIVFLGAVAVILIAAFLYVNLVPGEEEEEEEEEDGTEEEFEEEDSDEAETAANYSDFVFGYYSPVESVLS